MLILDALKVLKQTQILPGKSIVKKSVRMNNTGICFTQGKNEIKKRIWESKVRKEKS